MEIYILKIAWSENKWKGMPSKKEDYEKMYKYAKKYRWVKKNGIAAEWWNFYEDFDKDFYYFRGPTDDSTKKIKDGDIVFLISRNKEGRQFIGVMGECKKFPMKKEFSYLDLLNKNLLNTKHENWIKEKNRNFPKVDNKDFSLTYIVGSKKDLSFCLDKPIKYEDNEDKGIPDIRIAHLSRIPNKKEIKKEEAYKEIIKMLEEAKKENPTHSEKIDKIINKIKTSIDKIINKDKTINKIKTSNESLSPIINALQSKPFLILAGISGTGKTQIARLIAEKWNEQDKIKEFIDENFLILIKEISSTNPEQVAFLPVRPDWNEPVKMWGFYNPLTGLFYPTDGLKVLLNAYRDYVKNKDENKDENRKYFIILDEMNLARVEYYMSDLLSLMENMCKKEGDKIIIGETAMIHQLSRCVLSKLPEEDKEEWSKYIKKENKEIKWKIEGEKLCMEECKNCPYKALKENEKEEITTKEMEDFIEAFSPIPPRIAYPPNLVIMGTVNVDETTFSFSPKVLDRAFVIDLNEVYVKEYLKTCTDLNDDNIESNAFFKFVNTLIEILQPANLHFGYRVIHEMLEYLENAGMIKKENEGKFKLSELPENIEELKIHFNFLLKSKVLPKIHGGEERVEEVLRNLLAYCYKDEYKNIAEELKKIENWWEKSLDEIKDKIKEKKGDTEIELRFKESAEKILEMYRRLKDTGYCSYF